MKSSRIRLSWTFNFLKIQTIGEPIHHFFLYFTHVVPAKATCKLVAHGRGGL